MNKLKRVYQNSSIRWKLILAVVFTTTILFAVNLFLYGNINDTIEKMNQIYTTNTNLNNMEETLEEVQNNMFAYLNTKSSVALENFYRYEQVYLNSCMGLTETTTNQPSMLMEKTVRRLSATYLELTSYTVQAKRGGNIEKYKVGYEEATEIYNYINTYIHSLNNEQFKNNSKNYGVLLASLKYLEIISTTVLFAITVLTILLLILITRNITKPLIRLVEAANEIASGNLNIHLLETKSLDEVGIVTNAFNTMVISINEYIEKLRKSMELENQMKEKELLMTSHLKDAQLKYLQAQINPHFLFNTLNAGAQLAMMEDAEKTYLFVENMAEFFRYNVQKMDLAASLEEEIKVVDNYIYILNVRFSGEIQFIKQLDYQLLNLVRVPSMILQPIVENAVNYGIRDIEWEGKIILSIYEENQTICISIRDNGKGMDEQKIAIILKGEIQEVDNEKKSTGIGLQNVIQRLRLFYNREDVIDIQSDGMDKGTEVIIRIPQKYEEEDTSV